MRSYDNNNRTRAQSTRNSICRIDLASASVHVPSAKFALMVVGICDIVYFIDTQILMHLSSIILFTLSHRLHFQYSL